LHNSYIYTIPAIRLCNTIIKGTYTHSHARSYSSTNSYNNSSTPPSNSSLVDLKLALSISSSADLELRLGFSLRFSLIRLSCVEVLLGFPLIWSYYIGSFSCLISTSLIWPSCVKTFSMLKNSLLEA
jgi:hypothetical protein